MGYSMELHRYNDIGYYSRTKYTLHIQLTRNKLIFSEYVKNMKFKTY